MINKRVVFVLFFFSIGVTSFITSKTEGKIISETSEYVCKRICCIARLKNLMSYLALLCEGDNCSKLAIDTSLLDQWQDFSSFRYIDDTDFQSRFLQKVFAAAVSLLNSYDMIDRRTELCLCQCFDGDSLENCLTVLDYVADVLLNDSYQEQRRSFSLSEYYQKHKITGETVTRRFYQIRRLRRVDEVLTQLVREQIGLDGPQGKQTVENLEALQYQVQDQRISDALISIVESKQLDPLVTVSQELTQFRYIGDEVFFQEMLMMMFSVYKGILLCCADSESMRERVGMELDAILELYEQVDLLSTQELLGGIDMATDHMQLLLDSLDKKRTRMRLAKRASLATVPACILAAIAYYWYIGAVA